MRPFIYEDGVDHCVTDISIRQNPLRTQDSFSNASDPGDRSLAALISQVGAQLDTQAPLDLESVAQQEKLSFRVGTRPLVARSIPGASDLHRAIVPLQVEKAGHPGDTPTRSDADGHRHLRARREASECFPHQPGHD